MEEVKEQNRTAKKEQKEVNAIHAQTAVVNYPVQMWHRLAEFAVRNHMAAPTDVTALKAACQIPAVIPNTYQSKRLLLLLQKAIDEGFVTEPRMEE